MAEEVELHAGQEGDGHYRAKGFDWLLLCPHLGSSEKVALMILCGLSNDGWQRNLTLEEIGDLLIKGPVEVDETPKRMSVSGVAKVLNRLSELGQIVDSNDKPIKVSNRMTAPVKMFTYRLPRHTCEASRNVFDALARARGEDPKWPLATMDAHESEPAVRHAYKSVRPAQKSVREAQNNVRDAHNSFRKGPLTCEDGPFLSSFPSSSPSSSPSHARERENATPEAPLEEDEEMKSRGDKHTPSAPPQEWSAGRRAFEEATGGVQEALAGALGFLGTLPGLTGLQEGAYGFLADTVAEAFAAGWTEDALRDALKGKVDPLKAKNPASVPTWYVRHLAELPEPPQAVVPLCDNPAHVRNPMPDPVNGGCLHCNTQAITGPRDKTVMEAAEVSGTDDAVEAGLLFRQAIRSKRFAAKEPSRDENAALRSWRQADTARTQANNLIRAETV